MVQKASRSLAIAASFFLATSVVAAPKFTHANGGIALSGPSQYVSFNAFDYGATGDRGHVSYTNFDYPAPGTGVWNVGGTYALTVNLGGDYVHTMTIDTVTPISTTSTKFSGTGYYVADPTYTWTVTGIVSGSDISYTLVYTGTQAGYTFSAVGTIAADGSMSGTATDSLLQAPLTWSVPAGSVHEVLSYTAAVTCATIGATDATFTFTIPPGFGDLSGLNIVAKAHDGGSPGTNGDTWATGGGTIAGACDGPVTNYPIVGGNLVVH